MPAIGVEGDDVVFSLPVSIDGLVKDNAYLRVTPDLFATSLLSEPPSECVPVLAGLRKPSKGTLDDGYDLVVGKEVSLDWALGFTRGFLSSHHRHSLPFLHALRH